MRSQPPESRSPERFPSKRPRHIVSPESIDPKQPPIVEHDLQESLEQLRRQLENKSA